MLIFTQVSSTLAASNVTNGYMADTPISVEPGYFTNLTPDALVKLYAQKYVHAANYQRLDFATSENNFTLSQDVVEYLYTTKSSIIINYENSKGTLQEVFLYGIKLPENCSAINVHFLDITMGSNNAEVKQAFSTYGTVVNSFTVPEQNDQIDGVTYYTKSPYDNSKYNYNIYEYYNDDQSFQYVGSNFNTMELTSGSYFAVKTDSDNLIGFTQNQICYLKQLDDTIMCGLAHNKDIGVGISSDISELNLSSNTVSYIKEKDSNITIERYDVNSNLRKTVTTIKANQLMDGSLEYIFPKVTISDSNPQIENAFSGGTPEEYYSVEKQGNTVDGITSELVAPASLSGFKNWYAYYNGICIPVAFYSYSDVQIGLVDNQTYFSIPAEQDTYVMATEQSGIRQYSYLTDVSSATIKNIVKYYIENGLSNGAFTIRTISNQIELDAETVTLLKQNPTFDLSVSYVSADNKTFGTANLTDCSMFMDGNLTIERPDLEFSTNNETLSAMLPERTPAIYVTNKSTVVPGITYFYDNLDVLNSTLETDAKYYLLRVNDSKLTGDLLENSNAKIPVDNGTYCLVKASDYENVINSATQLSQQNIHVSDSSHVWNYIFGTIAGAVLLVVIIFLGKRKKKGNHIFKM
jgi:hypothetical protein